MQKKRRYKFQKNIIVKQLKMLVHNGETEKSIKVQTMRFMAQ